MIPQLSFYPESFKVSIIVYLGKPITLDKGNSTLPISFKIYLPLSWSTS